MKLRLDRQSFGVCLFTMGLASKDFIPHKIAWWAGWFFVVGGMALAVVNFRK